MVAANDHDVPAGGCGHSPQKVVVQFLGPVAGGSRVKDISGHQEGIHRFGLQGPHQPVQEGLVLLIASAPVKCPPQVPIRGMQKPHAHPRPSDPSSWFIECLPFCSWAAAVKIILNRNPRQMWWGAGCRKADDRTECKT